MRHRLSASDLSRSRKELYRGLVAGSASDPLVKQLGRSLSVELGARFGLLEQLSELEMRWPSKTGLSEHA